MFLVNPELYEVSHNTFCFLERDTIIYFCTFMRGTSQYLHNGADCCDSYGHGIQTANITFWGVGDTKDY